MNDLDSEKIAGSLCQSGMEPTQNPSDADVIILNTCSVREKAVQKVYARLGEIKRHRSRRQDLVVGVVGCMAQLEREKILKKAADAGLVDPEISPRAYIVSGYGRHENCGTLRASNTTPPASSYGPRMTKPRARSREQKACRPHAHSRHR